MDEIDTKQQNEKKEISRSIMQSPHQNECIAHYKETKNKSAYLKDYLNFFG